MPTTVSRFGIAMALLAALGFSTKSVFVKWAYQAGVSPEWLLSGRMLSACLMLLAIRFYQGRPLPFTGLSGKQFWQMLYLGFTGYYLSSWLDFRGLVFIPASVERFVLFIYPTFTVVLTAIIFRKRPSWWVWLALPVCYAGLFIMLGHPSAMGKDEWTGVLLVLASAVSYAVYLTLSPDLVKAIGPARFAEEVLFVSALMMLVHTLAAHTMVVSDVPWMALSGFGVALGLLGTVIPMYSLALAIDRLGSGRTAIIGMTGPVFTLVFCMLFLGESLSLRQGVGMAVIMVGVWMTSRK